MTELIIVPDKYAARGDCPYYLLVKDTGEILASHICSSGGFAIIDLWNTRKDIQKDVGGRFGEIELKYIGESDISEEELIRRNNEFYDTNQDTKS